MLRHSCVLWNIVSNHKEQQVSVLRIIVAAFAATLMLGSAAQADASTQLINAGQAQFGSKLAMEVATDGRVFIKPSIPGNFRQQWNKEAAGGGRVRYRNPAVNACLIVPTTAKPDDALRVGACNGVGLRNAWTRTEFSFGNGALGLVSASSGLAIVPNFFTFPSDLLVLESVGTASAVGPFSEYIGVVEGNVRRSAASRGASPAVGLRPCCSRCRSCRLSWVWSTKPWRASTATRCNRSGRRSTWPSRTRSR